MIITRFAPSPTGHLHLGNLRSCFLNWIFAKKNKGKFILRFDDTDKERSKDEFVTSINSDLQWLKIDYQETFFQSKRVDRYDELFDKLIEKNLVYPCFESNEDLEIKKKLQLKAGKPPIYDRQSLNLSKEEIEKKIINGEKPYWRFKLSQKKISWTDLVKGSTEVDLSSQSDPVLRRADGSYLYHFPSVVDDIDMNITHIIRGEDHITNSGIQIEIFNALDANIPIFGHNSLLVSENGEPFSKRNAAASIEQLKEKGIDPNAVNSLNASIGSSVDIEAYESLDLLADKFEISSLSKSPARYSNNQLDKLNSQLISNYDFDQISQLIKDKNNIFDEEFWDCIKQNISTLSEVSDWIRILNEPIKGDFNIEENFLIVAQELLPNEPWDSKTWNEWISKLKEKTQKKGKELFMPIRLALTGKTNGPELNKLILLMGYNKVMERLKRK